MSYSVDDVDVFRRSATYVDRILKGAKPTDLSVQTPIKYQALGLNVPPTLLARAAAQHVSLSTMW